MFASETGLLSYSVEGLAACGGVAATVGRGWGEGGGGGQGRGAGEGEARRGNVSVLFGLSQ